MSAHTPGPWEVFTVASPAGESARIHNGRLDIAHLPMEWNARTGGADARLIAAAPELLEAAKLACLNFSRSQKSGNFQGDDEHESWTALKRAIAKSEGR